MRGVLFLLLYLAMMPLSAEQILVIANMQTGNIDDWQHKKFEGQTAYQMVNIEGQRALRAVSQGTASGLFIEKRVDLTQTPYLNWRWRVEQPLAGLDEQSKQGDDYVARIYVVVSGGVLFWRSRALNYVWSGSQPINSHWDNAYTSQAKMIAVESGSKEAGKWQIYKRNVMDDMKLLFGDQITYIDAVAIMTDTDNSQREATAYYGDIYFSSE